MANGITDDEKQLLKNVISQLAGGVAELAKVVTSQAEKSGKLTADEYNKITKTNTDIHIVESTLNDMFK